ncbi:hypothetical protein GCM10010269_11000 [Streptomyces humidus]|uniref:VTT domain-containing protein n=1 Tax=Streptomyces humidus TaxID=52259 RepID=A0A918FS48_9ACTN|nr:VTT domain-containing protein [Streptomyces humidus]GGR73829.1 hypothetical protein GCM10010269_11000 [Streptomyces humidus]
MRSVAENAISDLLGHLPPVAVYAVVATAAPAESVLRVGAFIPTLTLLLTAGALARTGHTSLPLIIAVAAGAVVAGDFRAHRTGRLLADRLRTGRAGRRIPPAVWARAETLMARHGGRAVFLARFLPVVRGLAPHCAGAAHLPYHRIAPFSVTAACVWATTEASVGYAAASSLQHVLTLAGPAAAVLVLTATAAVLAVRRSRPHQEEGAALAAPADVGVTGDDNGEATVHGEADGTSRAPGLGRRRVFQEVMTVRSPVRPGRPTPP